ncbi:hypothetical protein CBR_g34410 [Chara braunii]|uniref:Right handed beta helix domain-containing protein n=1 Tax=Chara braunii TaxID=69332 RepID=A0A388LIH9_CHABU|nr:hypothetical protein CBR_g34410 [Chara braunii]|eukprot:GBG82129.1 hypothetical protein CBR_g34410 [Chara braunii]
MQIQPENRMSWHLFASPLLALLQVPRAVPNLQLLRILEQLWLWLWLWLCLCLWLWLWLWLWRLVVLTATTGRRSLLRLLLLLPGIFVAVSAAIPLTAGYGLEEFLAALNDETLVYQEVKGDVVLNGSLPAITGRNLTLVGRAPRGRRPVIDGASKHGGSESLSLTLKNLEFRNFNGTAPIFKTRTHDIVIQDCVFRNNRAVAGFFSARASVVYVSYGSLKISGSLFANNRVEGRFGEGGAVYAIGSVTVIERTVFRSNEAMGTGGTGKGGAMYIWAPTYRISDCVFEGNKVDGHGGAVVVSIAGRGEIVGSRFARNSAYSTSSRFKRYATGGAISIYGEEFTSISGCTFTENKAEGRRGGAVSLSMYQADVTMSGCKFERNAAGRYGGAVGARLVPADFVEGSRGVYLGDHGAPWSRTKFCRGNTYSGNLAGKSGANNIYVDVRNSSESGVSFCPSRPPLALIEAAPAAFLAALNDETVLYHEVKGDVVLNASLPAITGRNLTLVGRAPRGRRPVIDGASKHGGSESLSLTLKNLEFRNFNGMAPIFKTEGHDIVIEDCAFRNNRVVVVVGRAVSGSGCVVYVLFGSLKISGSLFANNRVEGRFGSGGAVYAIRNVTVIERTVFRSNEVKGTQGTGEAGAMYIWASTYRISDCVLEGNKVDGNGGALAITTEGRGEIVGSRFALNSAYSTSSEFKRYATGGAISIYGVGIIIISGCTFTENKAEGKRGGAVCLSMYQADVTISGCKFETNAAGRYGGAVGARLVPVHLVEGPRGVYLADSGPPRGRAKFCRGNRFSGNLAGKSGAENIYVDMRNSSESGVSFCPTRPPLALIEAAPAAVTISCAFC